MAEDFETKVVSTGLDRQGKPFKIDLSGTSLRIYLENFHVGRADYFLEEETGFLRLADIIVSKEARMPRTGFRRILEFFCLPRQVVNLRQRGLGSALLRELVKAAMADKRASALRGFITKSDLEEFPGLAHWYERNGFTVMAPTDFSIPNTVFEIRYTG